MSPTNPVRPAPSPRPKQQAIPGPKPAPVQKPSEAPASAMAIAPAPTPAPTPAPEPVAEPQVPSELLAPNVADQELRQLGTKAPEDNPLSLSDLAIPRLVLAQPTSVFEGAGEHPGQWFNSVTGDFSELLSIIVVRVALQRAVFPDPYDSTQPILCASNDALKPRAEYVGKEVEGITIYDTCFDCPLSNWTEDDPITGKGKPPRCDLMYIYTGLEVDTGMPFSLRLKGTALKTAKKLNTLFMQFKHTTIIQLGSALGKSSTGTRKFFVPTVALAKQPTPPFIMELAQQMLSREAPVTEEAPAVMPPEDDLPF